MTLEDAQNAAKKAVQFDAKNQYKQALYYYNMAVKYLSELQDSMYVQKLSEYRERISTIESLINEEEQKHHKAQSIDQSKLQKFKFLMNQAQDADEAGLKNIAVKLYTDAAELGLNMKIIDAEAKIKLTDLIKLALDRAESLKGLKSIDNNDILKTLSKLPSVPETSLDEDEEKIPPTIITTSAINSSNTGKQIRPSLHRGSSVHLKVSGGSTNYTEEEKKVLLHSSHINDHEFVPFMSIDLTEKFQYAIPFTDKDGLLALAPKQKPDFAKWCRPEELFSDPKMLKTSHVDYYSIRQTVVSDCSFVASLAVSAQYEKRFGRRLITSIIYPKNKNKEPIYNPFGKYMVKLHINGVPRKIIIDDLLPVSRYNQLLCSYSSNHGELWISLLEKAYMKVMGGYDFPGSNSNIDLHTLTGWIPERWAIRPNEPDFNKDNLFNVLLTRLHKGDVLVTVATGELSDLEADRTGLVPTHAYAVLDVRKINEEKLLQLKNPWSHLRWKGNYSELDTIHWTNELKEALNYDPDSASQFDNGIFWIDYDSICRFFDVFYLNWNPGLFNYTYCIHQMWNAGIGPVKDAYNIGDNPQFLLEIKNNVKGAIWILLTRHITDIADFRQNQEYITVLVYKNDGKRVYYPHDPPPYIDGVRINSPHYLCKIKLDTQVDTRYTLVISQYEKTNTIYYTLRAYGSCEFSLKKIPNFYKYEKELTGQWKDITAGGCSNHSTYQNNPRYQLILESSNNNNYLLIILKGPKQYQIGFDILTVVLNDSDVTTAFKMKSSGPFRSGFVYLELEEVPAGTYHIIPSTYVPGQEGHFFLICKSFCKLQLQSLQ
ncbi:calpain-7 [Apis mellifera caucasica]|uniref:Calpain-7 n=1 Tax=Apis mellifera TaxID=7460 RepID=A0A7M7MR17_APIME|nr:calpain-7 [Apis mellifera]KAG6797685.1 calpain-7 [Apis mellifera caucasica]KAG9437535.1 calpain-7 [Apis mellifera carnica]|eukprot:XP_026299697.1 calpain-7 [Apis mellifera]